MKGKKTYTIPLDFLEKKTVFMRSYKLFLRTVLLTALMITICSGSCLKADESTQGNVEILVEKISNGTGVKLSIIDKGISDFTLTIKGTPASSKYGKYFKKTDSSGEVYLTTEFKISYEELKKEGMTLVLTDLQPGTYKAIVRKVDFVVTKKFKIKESPNKGYKKTYDFLDVNQFDVIEFGAYEQDLDYTNGKEPIEWIVLEKTEKGLLLLSKYALDSLPYDKTISGKDWENCSLREWLNKVFYSKAFNKTEKKMIKSTKVINSDYNVGSVSGGNDTVDKIFLLSVNDVTNNEYGFPENDLYMLKYRKCAYAWDKGKYLDYESGIPLNEERELACYWWLRTPGYGKAAGACIRNTGELYLSGGVNCGCGYSTDFYRGVRPAMYIKLKSK